MHFFHQIVKLSCLYTLFFHQHANLLGSCTLFHHRASSSCIFITNFWTYQAYALLFSPPCKLSRLMHLFCHHLVNLSSSCSCFHHRVNLSNSCTLFSPPCELIKLMHSFFTTVWTYQTHALFFHHRVNLSSSCTPFSPPCELIKLMHSFFTAVWTYQSHALLFHHRVNLSVSCPLFQTAGIPTCILHMQEHCGSTEQSGRNLEILQRRKLCGTETLLGLLVWVKFQIKSIFIIHQYAKHKYYHW